MKRDRWTERKIDEYRSIDGLRSMSAADLRELVRLGDESAAAPGFALLEQGRRSRWAYVILGGSALVVTDGLVTGRLERGDVIGATAALTLTAAGHSVIAERDLPVLALGKREFTWLVERAPLLSAEPAVTAHRPPAAARQAFLDGLVLSREA